MEKSYFWNSVDGDRKYNAESISDMLLPFFKPGVFAGDLQVTAPGGMKVQIAGSEDRGFAWFRTKNYHNTANLVKDISAASGVLSRIDNVVVRKDTPNRTIYITIQEGTFATVPEAPAILRNAEFYDLKLAEITIPSGAIEITQANIKDCRMDANVCGWVAATIEEMDFTQISAQFDTYMEEYQEAAETEFTTWFNAMKGQLTTDAAGNLQTQINDIKTKYLEADKTVYVATTGSDTTGNGTSGTPYRTITKALSVIPKNLNGCSAIINIANGTYAESVIVSDFHGGELTLQISAGGTVTVSRLIVKVSAIFNIASTTSATAYLIINYATDIPFLVYKASCVKNAYVNITINGNSAYDGMVVKEFSQYQSATVNTITINNANSGVVVVNSKVYIYSLLGSGNVTGIYLYSGGIATVASNNISATTKIVKEVGSVLLNDVNPMQKIITWGSGNTPTHYTCYKEGNKVHVEFVLDLNVEISSGETVGTVPLDCRPSIATGFMNGGTASNVGGAVSPSNSFGIIAKVETSGAIVLGNYYASNMYGACVTIEYFVD